LHYKLKNANSVSMFSARIVVSFLTKELVVSSFLNKTTGQSVDSATTEVWKIIVLNQLAESGKNNFALKDWNVGILVFLKT